MFCNAENTKSIHDLTGAEDFEDYIEGIKLRKGGIRGLVDMIEVLKNYAPIPTNYRLVVLTWHLKFTAHSRNSSLITILRSKAVSVTKQWTKSLSSIKKMNTVTNL